MSYIQKSYFKKYGNKDNSMEGKIIEDINYLVEKSNNPTYKVYTALLSQSGDGNTENLYIGTDYGSTLTVGVTYTIEGNDTTDFTNVGAPNNDVGTFFVATGKIPNNQNGNGMTYVSFNTGAPVATVLENTIGNITWYYKSTGDYYGKLKNAFTENKTFTSLTLREGNVCILNGGNFSSDDEIGIGSNNPIDTNSINIDGVFQIEIRVYN